MSLLKQGVPHWFSRLFARLLALGLGLQTVGVAVVPVLFGEDAEQGSHALPKLDTPREPGDSSQDIGATPTYLLLWFI